MCGCTLILNSCIVYVSHHKKTKLTDISIFTLNFSFIAEAPKGSREKVIFLSQEKIYCCIVNV